MDFRICRVCFVKVEEDDCYLVTEYAEIFAFCTSVKIEPHDGLPQFICRACSARARDAFNFRILCEESDMYLKCEQILQIDVNQPVHRALQEESEVYVRYKEILQIDDVEQPITETEKIREQLKCGSCNMIFYYRKPLIKHEQKHKEGYTCKDCGKSYPSARLLAIHINVKKRKGSHLCQICGKAYTMPENLKRHQRIHAGIRPFPCQVCEKAFTQSNELKSHMITHTAEKKFLCSYCGQKYARETSLQVHIMRIHTTVTRQHKCGTCGRTFKGLGDMKMHQSIHSGTKKYICKTCSKAFNKKSNLKVHERIHTGQRPFVCQVCQRSFIQKHVLNKHLAVHTKQVEVECVAVKD